MAKSCAAMTQFLVFGVVLAAFLLNDAAFLRHAVSEATPSRAGVAIDFIADNARRRDDELERLRSRVKKCGRGGGRDAVDGDPTLKAWPDLTVLAPTCAARRSWHPNLLAMFVHQDYPGRLTLLVHDDNCAPKYQARLRGFTGSSVLKELNGTDAAHGTGPERKVLYHLDGRGNFTRGSKRSWLLEHAATDLVAHMDDDDYYGPAYLRTMTSRLLSDGDDGKGPADMVKLRGWLTMTESFHKSNVTNRQVRTPTFVFEDLTYAPMGWEWTYLYNRSSIMSDPTFRYGDTDFSEGTALIDRMARTVGFTARTYVDETFTVLRIVTRSKVRATGFRKCEHLKESWYQGKDLTCLVLPEYMALGLLGGKERLQPWLDKFDARSR